LCLITRMLLQILAGALVPLAIHAKDSSKDLSIEVVETHEERLLWRNPPTAIYSAKVILPDGAHAQLTCELFDNGCGTIEPWTPPEKTAPADCQVSDNEESTKLTVSCTRKGDDLTIYGRKGKVTYRIVTGPW